MEQRVAIVTGASSGLGRAVAWRAARQSFAVVAAARRADRLHAVARRIEAAGGSALPVVADVARLEDQRRLIEGAVPLIDRLVALSRLRVLRPVLRQILALIESVRRDD